MKLFPLMFVALFLAFGTTVEAQAQISNRPYAFQGGGVGAGAGFGSWSATGISPAYQQLILQRKLLGHSTNNGSFIQAGDGSLINITRGGSQAFPTAIAGPFLTASFGGGASGFSVGSFGYGGGDGTADYGVTGIAPRGAPAAAVPIDGWIGQLNSMDKPAS